MSKAWQPLLTGLLAGLALGIVLLFGVPDSPPTGFQSGRPAATDNPIRDLKGSAAPAFSTQLADGSTISLSDYAGQVLLLNFWATWCAPCEVEMPLLQQRYNEWQDQGLIILGVNFDEPADQVAAYGREQGIEFPLLLDPGGEIQQLYQIRGYPTTYFIDRQGTIQDIYIGLLSEKTIDEWLASAGLEGS